MLCTGLDLHRSLSYITAMDERGQIIGQKRLPGNGQIVDLLLAGLAANRSRSLGQRHLGTRRATVVPSPISH